MKKALKYVSTAIVVLVAVAVAAVKYHDYIVNPWTRDGTLAIGPKLALITSRRERPQWGSTSL